MPVEKLNYEICALSNKRGFRNNKYDTEYPVNGTRPNCSTRYLWS